MTTNNLNKYANKLDECWNNHCHEGTLNLLGYEITVFTREPEYDENGEVKEDFIGIGDKCAFVNQEYWTGWYEQELMEDLYRVMQDATEYVLNKKPVKFNVAGTIDEDICDEYSIKDLTQKVTEFLQHELYLNDFSPENLTVKVCKKSQSFTATFNDKWFGCNAFFLKNERTCSSDGFDATISCPDNLIQQYFNEAFNFTISF